MRPEGIVVLAALLLGGPRCAKAQDFSGTDLSGLGDVAKGMKAVKDKMAADKETQAPGTKFPYDRETMKAMVERAEKYRKEAVPGAIEKLKKLKESPTSDPKALEAVKKWLNVEPSDAAFGPTLTAAMTVMGKNRDSKLAYLIWPDNQEHCKDGKTLMAFVIDATELTVVLCPNFMEAGETCQRAVLIHEAFHLGGLGPDLKKDLTFPTRTTEEALKDAFYMGRLTQHLYSESPEFCHVTYDGKVESPAEP